MSVSLLVELVIAVALIALLMVYCHRELFMGAIEANNDDDDDKSPPLLAIDHPMRIKSRSEFDALIAREQDTIIFVGAPWCGYCHSAIGSFIEAADGHRGKTFVLEVKGKEMTRLVQDIGVNAYPVILKSHRDGTRSKYDGERTTAAFREYINDDKKTEDISTESDQVQSEPLAAIATAPAPAQLAAPAAAHVAQVDAPAAAQAAAQVAVDRLVDSLITTDHAFTRPGTNVPVAVVMLVLSTDTNAAKIGFVE